MTTTATSPPGRGTYALLALASALFLAYGSLVPFNFEAISWSEAFTRFSAAMSWPPSVDSRTDFVTNILIAIPLGYFGMAALCSDFPWQRRLIGLLVVLPSCLAVALLVEFAQVFFPFRTDSLSDIVAQGIGAAGGVLAWIVAGDVVTGWLRDSIAEREPPALLQRLVLIYVVLFALSQVMPLDLTLNLGELAQKYRRGGILLVPFTFKYDSRFEQAWDLMGTLVLNAPLGAAAVLLGTRRDRRRGVALAVILAVVAVALIECAQVFVMSRIAYTTDFIMGAVGASVGAVLTVALGRRAATVATVPQRRSVVLGWDAVFLWTCALITYHWSPFDFNISPTRVTIAVHQLMEVPFRSYYAGDQFHAFNEILRKSLLGLPLGMTLAFALPSHSARALRRRLVIAWGIALCILLAIEIGQVFVPSRTPDITDPLVGSCGAIVGFLITDRLRALASQLVARV